MTDSPLSNIRGLLRRAKALLAMTHKKILKTETGSEEPVLIMHHPSSVSQTNSYCMFPVLVWGCDCADEMAVTAKSFFNCSVFNTFGVSISSSFVKISCPSKCTQYFLPGCRTT